MQSLSKYEDIRTFITDWNIKYPVDRWWRDKHKVAFNSPIHRSSSFIDQLIEYEEDVLFEELYKKSKKDEEQIDTEYIRGTGNWLKQSIMSEKEMNEAFDNLDLDTLKFDE